MSWSEPLAKERQQVLAQAQSIAIVGVSSKKSRASYFVASYLMGGGYYRVYFVNPMIEELFGHPVYKSLTDLPETPDIVDVFRKSEDTPQVLADAHAVGAPVLWLQLGVWNEDVAHQGTELGMTVVMNRCVKIEHARFHGGLHLAGFNTGVISSRRAPS